MRAEISYDLVMDEAMEFVEGTYRLAGGEWEVLIFTPFTEALEPRWKRSCWESGVTGVFVEYPRSMNLNKGAVEAVLSEALGVTEWVEVRGPDSMMLR